VSDPARRTADDRLDIPAPRPRYDWEQVATLDELPEGAVIGVTAPGGRAICLFNNQGEIGAIHDCCTHAEFAMSEGTLHADGTIECVWHGARFDCRTGAARKAPAVDPITVYDVRVEDGAVFVGNVKRPEKR
jgi:3-phenylpropionate/trans-cinnamate dioxygenase ferredoxin component